MTGRKNQSNRFLRLVRKRRGLGQKQLANLLGHTMSQLSRIENGRRIPGLKTALKMEILLGEPVRFLFHDLHEQLATEIGSAAATNQQQLPIPSNYCSFANNLEKSYPSREELDAARRHNIDMVRQVQERTTSQTKGPVDKSNNQLHV